MAIIASLARRIPRDIAVGCAFMVAGFVLGWYAQRYADATGFVKSLSPGALRRCQLSFAFRPRMNSNEKAAALRCLSALDDAFQSANVTYFLYGGTLLGAYRHRGIIPWDDDVDVLANFTQAGDIERALRSVPGYELHLWHKRRFKFYPRDGVRVGDKAWRWPYVDVCFFEENATHVYENFPGQNETFVYPKEEIFPLARRPFDNLLLPSPVNEERAVGRNYDEKTCENNRFSHRDEGPVGPPDIVMSAPCTELHSMYSFVFRNASTPPMVETLKIDGVVVRQYVTN